MKKNSIVKILFLGLLTIFASCIQEEAPNAECDIIAFSEDWLESNKEYISGKPTVPADYPTALRINFKNGTDIELLKNMEPQFVLTPGATIEKLGVELNGESGVIITYRTTSEDRMFHREYNVYLTIRTVIEKGKPFSFELYEPEEKGRYNIWYEEENDTKLYWWASGNAGIAFINPKVYPTSVEENGYVGKCVKLETCKTNRVAQLAGMPIAAGNIFLGEFNSANAMKAPLQATRFGLQIVPDKPLFLHGYYKYTAGEEFTNVKLEVIPDRNDGCAIYSVLYEVDPENVETLDGANILSSDRIVMVAELENPGEPEEWTEFKIPYKTKNGKAFDIEKMQRGEYAITVVASSSKDGALFEGAVGSTLYVDEIEIIWEDN